MSDTVPVEFLFELALTTAPDAATFVPNGPHGTRGAVAITGGSFEGPRLRGTVLTPAGDWLTLRANDVMELDVRLSLVTDDGAAILMRYQGVGGPDVGGKRTLRAAPMFETGDVRYAWLNDLQAIGRGEADVAAGAVRYQVYALS